MGFWLVKEACALPAGPVSPLSLSCSIIASIRMGSRYRGYSGAHEGRQQTRKPTNIWYQTAVCVRGEEQAAGERHLQIGSWGNRLGEVGRMAI